MEAVICPVCRGKGQVCKGMSSIAPCSPILKTCHGCNGKGWVVIPSVVVAIPRQEASSS